MLLLPQAGSQAGTKFVDDGGDRCIGIGVAQGALSILQLNPEGKAFLFI
jgi:hypothetical protein